MTKVRVRGEAVRKYILANVEKHPADIARMTADRFGITRQAVNKHLQKLVGERALKRHGKTRSRAYQLAPLAHWRKTFPLAKTLAEDRVWREDVVPSLGQMPRNVLEIWHYGFTEIFNNAIDHSEGSQIAVDFRKTASTTQIAIHDNGVGIFKKIQTALGLIDERHAVLELAKGKLTTDPARHTGEGIFFASRMFDDFEILSGGIHFSHQFDKKEDWILERDRFSSGTAVWMKLNNHTARTTKKVFDQFTSGEDYGFTKTVVPVKLAQYGDENLVSRSQAKRLLARVERFETVILDFSGVESVGQAFADEIFRVFAAQHPKVTLLELNTNSAVKRMISRARAHTKP
jgi:anti-sigma regulatory factor (Ser/Thr protein kinase)